MRLEFINRVLENDILGKSILTNEGQVLLRAGVRLTDNYIFKLKDMGVFFVYIKDERLEDVNVEDESLTELKQVTMKSIADIARNVSEKNRNKLRQTLSTVENLIDYIIDLGDINKSLYDIQTYDNYTYVHSIDTCIMAAFMGMGSKMNSYDLKELGIGAILHDVGKIKIPDRIIKKQGKLTIEEYVEIKKHTTYGVDLLKKNLAVPPSVIKIVEQHHERVDGKGYPNGLTDKQISKFAKIVCVCDVYDSVSSDRCYRKKFSPNDAYELILSASGTCFDENMVRIFKNTFSIYPLGCCIRLSNGDEGYIIRQNRGFPDRPVIRILYERQTKRPVPFYEIDLLKNPNIIIIAIV